MQRVVISPEKRVALEEILSRYSSYKKFSRAKKYAYQYTALMGLRVCPYCNINFTYTIANGLRPDLDHYQSQSEAPREQLAVDNLIPCCQQCNSRIKLAKSFTVATHLHPFVDDFDSIKKFSIVIRNVDYLNHGNFDIAVKDRIPNHPDKARADRLVSDMKLDVRYQSHKLEVVEVLERAKFYHASKMNEFKYLLGPQSLNSRELKRLLFPVAEIMNVPLQKLRQDIAEDVLSTGV